MDLWNAKIGWRFKSTFKLPIFFSLQSKYLEEFFNLSQPENLAGRKFSTSKIHLNFLYPSHIKNQFIIINVVISSRLFWTPEELNPLGKCNHITGVHFFGLQHKMEQSFNMCVSQSFFFLLSLPLTPETRWRIKC